MIDLSSEKDFGVVAMTEAINALPQPETILGNLGLFGEKGVESVDVKIEMRDGELRVLPNKARGSAGTKLHESERSTIFAETLHIPAEDLVLADDVQGVREFGTNKPQSVVGRVNDRLEVMKSSIVHTQEHLRLGALAHGKVFDADGKSVLLDVNKAFGVERKKVQLDLTSTGDPLRDLDNLILTGASATKNTFPVSKWLFIGSPDLILDTLHHKGVKDIYKRWEDKASAYLDIPSKKFITFEHKNITFVAYTTQFGESQANFEEGEGTFLPYTKDVAREYFAPSPYNETVNTLGLPYYASRKVYGHNEGWELKASSNPLPLIVRPHLVFAVRKK